MTAFSQVVTDCILSKRASRYSENTLRDYQTTYNKFMLFLDKDPDIQDIEDNLIAEFLASQTDVCDKTVLNYHIGLSSLWTWAAKRKIVDQNIVRLVTPPKPTKRKIIPLTRQEIVKLLKAAHKGNFLVRDQSIIFLLLDTGIRASELSNLRIKDFYWHNQQMLILGKGSKERLLRFSLKTKKILIKYLRERKIVDFSKNRNQPVYVSSQGNPFSRDTLRQMINRLRDRAGIPRCHAHLFRHTFAIEFLRNGGDIYTLQEFLGHTTLDMVKRYLQIVQSDIDRVHKIASPVTIWDIGDV